MKSKIPTLPQLLSRKIYKTGQTRGADDDVIFQNRVGRNSTVLIPYQLLINPSFCYPDKTNAYENGFIVLLKPEEYFENSKIESELKDRTLGIGINCLVFYETREQWDSYNPDKLNWAPAQKRSAPLGGNYVARVPGTTAKNGGDKIIRGFTTTAGKGAGIRLYEYASSDCINQCRVQLEAIYWLCFDSEKVLCENGMTAEQAAFRKAAVLWL